MLAAAIAAFALQFAAAPAAAETNVRGWSVHVDNDAFASRNDRDYTAGFSFSLGGEGAHTHPLSLARALAWTDRRSGFARAADGGRIEGGALGIGLLLFTPDDLDVRQPIYDDRPYASLAYVSTSKLAYDAARQTAFQSSLTLGVLGLPLAETLHRGVHRAIGSALPRGYDHQISDGGEPAFRYAVSRHRLLAGGSYANRPYTLQFGFGASVGYVTEVSGELGLRWGYAPLPWWAPLPGATNHEAHTPLGASRLPASDRTRVMLDAGLKVRGRAYNSFLQGQFRDSRVEYSSSDVEHVLFEAWIGVTTVLENRLSVSYTVRRQTEELEIGRGARSFVWASIGVTQQF